MAAPTEVLQGFADYNPTILFRGLLDGVDGSPPLLQGINLLFLAFGGVLVLWGHAMRAKGKRGQELLDEQIRTVVVFAMMFMCGSVLSKVAQGMDAIQRESGLGNSTQIASRMVQRAYAMPELTRAFDAVYAADAQQAARQRGGGNDAAVNQKISDDLDGTMWGTTKAFFRALVHEGAELAKKAGDVASTILIALEKLMVYLQAFAGAMIKILIIIATISLVHIFLLCGGAIMWVMENLRYFFLAVGAAFLPLFIGGFALPESNPFRRTSYEYVMNMLGYAMWPLAWTIGHSVTVELYNAWVALMAGTSRVGVGLEAALKWQSASSFSEQQQVMQQAMADWLGGSILQLLALPLGALGLFMWIIAVTIYGPTLLHKMLTTGAAIASELTKQTASQSAQVAGSALQVGSTIASGGTAIGLQAAGGAVQGGARGGFGGMIAGVGEGAMSGYWREQQLSALQSRGGGGGGGDGGGAPPPSDGGMAAAASANK